MSFIFKVSARVVDVGVLLLQGFIGCCWVLVIYRMVSLGDQLDILSLPSIFPHYPSLSTASTSFNYWFSLVCEIFFGISLLEVLFSIYCLYLVRWVQAKPESEPRPFEILKDLLLQTLGSGLIDPDQISSTTEPNQENPIDPDSGKVTRKINLDKPLPYNHPKAIEFRQTCCVWYQNCRWEDIYHDNHLEWLCSVLLNKEPEEVKEEDKHRSKQDAFGPQLEEIMKAIEKRAGAKIPYGYNEKLSHRVIKLEKDPVNVTLRPLTLSYGLTWSLNETIRQMMKFKGFEFKKCSNRKHGLKYLVRIPKSWRKLPVEQRPPPVIFIHGIGMGFLLYISIIQYLTFSKWANERPVMVFIQPHISMEIFSSVYFRPPTQAQLTRDFQEALEDLGFDQTGFELLAHSNGTVVAGWIMKEFPKLVKRSCLLDPICFALWEGHVCYNFLYSKPMSGLEKLVRFTMAEEMGIAWYTRRHFNWPDAVLWPHQIPGFRDPSRFIVLLSGKDTIINAHRVRRYLLEEGMTDAFPTTLTSNTSCQPKSLQQGEREPLIEVEVDRHNFSPSDASADSCGRLKMKGDQLGCGGIIFDPESAHGEALVPGHPHLKAIIEWLEGNGIRLCETNLE